MRSIWKTTGLGILCELWVKERWVDYVISWEYTTVLLAFCNDCIFFTYFWFSSCSSMSTEKWTKNIEQQINLKFLVWLKKTPLQALKMLQQVCGDNTMFCICVFESPKMFKWERQLQEQEAFNHQDWGQHQPCKAGGCGNHHLSVWMTAIQLDMKRDHLDYHRSEEALHTDVSGHHQASLNWTTLTSVSHQWWWDLDFWVQSKKQVPEQAVKVSDVTNAEENQKS